MFKRHSVLYFCIISWHNIYYKFFKYENQKCQSYVSYMEELIVLKCFSYEFLHINNSIHYSDLLLQSIIWLLFLEIFYYLCYFSDFKITGWKVNHDLLSFSL